MESTDILVREPTHETLSSQSLMQVSDQNVQAPASPKGDSKPVSPAPSSPLSSALSTLSSAPSSPVWPSLPQLCKETMCPIDEVHYEGLYLYNNQPPEDINTIFGDANPPPFVWESVRQIKIGLCDIDHDYVVLYFLQYHAPVTEASKLATLNIKYRPVQAFSSTNPTIPEVISAIRSTPSAPVTPKSSE